MGTLMMLPQNELTGLTNDDRDSFHLKALGMSRQEYTVAKSTFILKVVAVTDQAESKSCKRL